MTAVWLCLDRASFLKKLGFLVWEYWEIVFPWAELFYLNFPLGFRYKTGRSCWQTRWLCCVQRDLKRLEKCAGQESREAQQREAQSPVLGEEKPQAPGQTGDWQSAKHLGSKGPGGPAGHQVDYKSPKVPTVSLGLIKQSIASRWREVVTPVYSALLRHMGPASSSRFLSTRDMNILQWAQWTVAKMVKGLDHLSHEAERAGIVQPREQEAHRIIE